jgi:hypothetical protein
MACKIARSQRLRLLSRGISQQQGVRNDTKDNSGLETKHQGQSGTSFSHHVAISDAELPESLWEYVDKGCHLTVSEYCN